jgi:alpha-glucosidase
MSFIQTLKSPNENLVLEVDDEGGQLRYRLIDDHSQVIRWSRLGLSIKSSRAIGQGVKLMSSLESSLDEVSELPWGQNKLLHTKYNELYLEFRETSPPMRIFAVRFRLFNDGLAFRYEIPAQDELEEVEIAQELTEFNVPKDTRAWWIPSYQPDRYEYLYTKTLIGDMPVVHTPLTLQYSNGRHVAIHEAALYDFGSMNITPTDEGGLRSDITPMSSGVVASLLVANHYSRRQCYGFN